MQQASIVSLQFKQIRFLLLLLLVSISTQLRSQDKAKGDDEIKIDEPENGGISNGTYTCNLFDWKIEIPPGYEVTSVRRVEELQRKGYEAAKTSLPNGITVRVNPTHLIGFGIDKRNAFSASFESLAGTKKMNLEQRGDFVAKLLSDTYSKVEGLKFDVEKSFVTIGEYNFYKIHVKLYSAKTGEQLLIQDLYNSMVKENLFSASINYTSEEVGKLLTSNFYKSLDK